MIERLKNNPAAAKLVVPILQAQGWLAPRLLRRRTFSAALIASLCAILYWGWLASDLYVSEAHIVIQRTDVSSGQSMDFGSLLTGINNANQADQMLLMDYLLSVDMMKKLDAKLNLRAHYSDPRRDLLSRMWDENSDLELFHQYYMSHTSITYDEQAGVLVIKASAYDPKMAHAIASMLVEEGGKYMNQLAQNLVKSQIAFLEQQVAQRADEFSKTRQAMLNFQNVHGLVSPQSAVETLSSVVSTLEGRLSELKTQRNTLLGYLAPNAPSVVEVDLQIKAVKKQIADEQSRLTSTSGAPLNRVLEQFVPLQFAAQFAEDVYKTALVSLETGRVEATRTLKKVSVLQSPTFPQYPLEPRRVYNIVVFILLALVVAGIVHLLAAIIRDHRD